MGCRSGFLVAIGILGGVVILVGAFFVVDTPRPLFRKSSWLAERSGRSDKDGWADNTGGWTGDSE